MTFNLKHGALVAAFSLLGTASAAQATQFIVNGEFTSPNTGTGYSNTQTVPGWQNLNETYVEVGYSPIYGLPGISTGNQNLEVNNNVFGNVVQTVTGLTVGQLYTLSFDYGGRPGYGAQKLNVTFGGTLLAQDSGSLGAWESNIFSVRATATSETLGFQALDVGGSRGGGNEITNVSLTGPNGVPEPATWAMMLVGFAMTGVALRRRAAPVRVSFG